MSEPITRDEIRSLIQAALDAYKRETAKQEATVGRLERRVDELVAACQTALAVVGEPTVRAQLEAAIATAPREEATACHE